MDEVPGAVGDREFPSDVAETALVDAVGERELSNKKAVGRKEFS